MNAQEISIRGFSWYLDYLVGSSLLFTFALWSKAQQPGKIFRIGLPGYKHCFW